MTTKRVDVTTADPCVVHAPNGHLAPTLSAWQQKALCDKQVPPQHTHKTATGTVPRAPSKAATYDTVSLSVTMLGSVVVYRPMNLAKVPLANRFRKWEAAFRPSAARHVI